MTALKKVKREEGGTYDEFLTELFHNNIQGFGQKLKNLIFQKNEKIRNLLLENADFRIQDQNKEFEIKELKLKNEKITRKFDHCINLLKKERLSNEFLKRQIESDKENNLDKPIIDEIEELVAERTTDTEEEAAPLIPVNNDVSELAITEVHSEVQSDDEDEDDHHDILTREGTGNQEPEPASYHTDLIDISEDDVTIAEEDVEGIDNFSISEDDTEDQLEADTLTLKESDTDGSSGLENTETPVDDMDGSLLANIIYDQLEDEPVQWNQDDHLEDTFADCETEADITGEEETGDIEMDLTDSTDIIEENTSAGESLAEDMDTLNNSEDTSDDVSKTSDDDSEMQETLIESTEEVGSSERTDDDNEPESVRVKEAESCSSLGVPTKSVARNRNKMNKVRKRRLACGHCSPCTIEDCGDCSNCLDKPKFGGQGKKKQKCVLKKCENPS